jgi:hypothetical protein
MNRSFSGNPKLYLKISVYSAIYIFVWLYGGTALIMYLWSGETWLLNWKILLFVVVFTAWYGRYTYRFMMRLDGQYGSGSGWTLNEERVKLPEIRSSGQSRRSPHGPSDSK